MGIGEVAEERSGLDNNNISRLDVSFEGRPSVHLSVARGDADWNCRYIAVAGLHGQARKKLQRQVFGETDLAVASIYALLGTVLQIPYA